MDHFSKEALSGSLAPWRHQPKTHHWFLGSRSTCNNRCPPLACEPCPRSPPWTSHSNSENVGMRQRKIIWSNVSIVLLHIQHLWELSSKPCFWSFGCITCKLHAFTLSCLITYVFCLELIFSFALSTYFTGRRINMGKNNKDVNKFICYCYIIRWHIFTV